MAHPYVLIAPPPIEVIEAARTVKTWAQERTNSVDWQLGGLCPVEWIERATARIAELEKKVQQVTAAHRNLINRNAFLRQRPDLPPARVRAYRELLQLQDENAHLKAALELATKK